MDNNAKYRANFEADARLEPYGTVFYLVGQSKEAQAAIVDPRHRRLLVETHTYGTTLRITLDNPRAGCLVQICSSKDDAHDTVVVRGTHHDIWCRFFFNGHSGELLLRDESRHRTATLKQFDSFTTQPHTTPNILKSKGHCQCAVVLCKDPYDDSTRSYELAVDKAVFHIWPPFAHRPIDMAAKAPFSVYDGLKMQWPDTMDQKLVLTTTVEDLGSGGEGSVQLVAISKNGHHYACKRNILKSKPRCERAVELLNLLMRESNKVSQSYIVPCLHYQLSGKDQMEIFMPAYWCSLDDLIDGGCFQKPETSVHMAARMLLDISTALVCLKSLGKGVVHRDVKPGNILYIGGHFYLADFGSSKKVNKTHTKTGTTLFQSPEVRNPGNHSPAMDVFSLGLTLVACTIGACPLSDVWRDDDSWQNWVTRARSFISSDLAGLGPAVTAMLQEDPRHRPRASDVRLAAKAYLGEHKDLDHQYVMPDKKLAKQFVQDRRQKLQSTVYGPQNQPQCETRSLSKDSQTELSTVSSSALGARPRDSLSSTRETLETRATGSDMEDTVCSGESAGEQCKDDQQQPWSGQHYGGQFESEGRHEAERQRDEDQQYTYGGSSHQQWSPHPALLVMRPRNDKAASHHRRADMKRKGREFLDQGREFFDGLHFHRK